MHAPGTLRNDQFRGNWDGYFQRVEEAVPAPAVLGITDYFTLRGYKEVLKRRNDGALSNVSLIFANVELRLTIETGRRQGINLHLLVSPEKPDHVERMEEKLARFLFPYGSDRYPCTDDGLRRLGRAHRRDQQLPDDAALEEGAGQFKVELDAVRELFDRDPWVRDNVLVAVAAGLDGLSGIAKDAQFHAQREDLGRFAHIVFSATPSDRAYWLGNHPNFATDGQRPKPCLQGSDAHSLDDVLRPFTSDAGSGSEPRICWIRAEPTFDGLRQTLVEPARRVHVGATPPGAPAPSDTIRALRLRNAPWLQTDEIILNDGLVSVIGARGSGKTALADLIAFAADADEDEPGDASFLEKAGPLLSGLETEIEWCDGERQPAALPRRGGAPRQPRVRYLSQKFVENLCSASERTDSEGREPLNDEIEHVVFSSIPDEDRLMCASFAELRTLRLEDFLAREENERDRIREKTNLISEKNLLRKSLDTLKSKALEAERARKAAEMELAKIPIKADDATSKAYSAATEKLNALKTALASEQRKQQSVTDLTSEVERQARTADSTWHALREKYEPVLTTNEWELLRFRMHADALPTLRRVSAAVTEQIEQLRQRGQPNPSSGAAQTAAPIPQSLKDLEAECERLTKALGLDQANARRRTELERQVTATKQLEEKARFAQAQAEGAGPLLEKLRAERGQSYMRVFEALDAQRQTLIELYQPLREQLATDPRLSKLNFAVERSVDLDRWAALGERLLDLRRAPFNGKGELAQQARTTLLQAWKVGTPEEVRTAMETFTSIANHSVPAQGVTFAEVGEWLYSTEHIAVRYSIRYEGLDLSQLSPGTRGVVLLTLYLGLDQWDRRPLVIDQPEENLDPRSVYQELVPFFRDAAKRRQIIMVTHNANLVVNTDSDQIIVAESERQGSGQLPRVTYVAGGLEDPEIRSHVCRLLEGGEEAFEKRRMRYSGRNGSSDVVAP
ncbi:MAG: AAA family ATPase [Pseudomonadota bacterium]